MKSMTTKSRTPSKPQSAVVMAAEVPQREEERLSRIATAAYYRAEARGFSPGQEMDDWLQAEAAFNSCAGH